MYLCIYGHLGSCSSSMADPPLNPHAIQIYPYFPSQWRHNGRKSVSNHQPHNCVLNCLFRRRSKKITRNAENVSIWWRHHDSWKHILQCLPLVGRGISLAILWRHLGKKSSKSPKGKYIKKCVSLHLALCQLMPYYRLRLGHSGHSDGK